MISYQLKHYIGNGDPNGIWHKATNACNPISGKLFAKATHEVNTSNAGNVHTVKPLI